MGLPFWREGVTKLSPFPKKYVYIHLDVVCTWRDFTQRVQASRLSSLEFHKLFVAFDEQGGKVRLIRVCRGNETTY